MAKDPAFLFYSNDLKIKECEWNTPNTYDKNHAYLPENKGVYLIVGVSFIPFDKEIIYIGSSKNISNRHKSHEITKKAIKNYDHIQIYFKEIENELEYEKYLISKIKPVFNKHYKND